MLVGENLGTVPPQVNRALKRHGVRTMYVVQYEASDDPKRPLREPPRECVAGINTHDMPSWFSYWEARDIVDRRSLGLLKAAEVSTEAKRRARVRRALEKFLRSKGLLAGKGDAGTVLAALLRFLSRSRAELVLVNLEDLWLEPEPQNTPGTSTERVNWRRKTSRSFEEMLSRPDVQEMIAALKR
jgi:4-alpha-glucanotransferase